jgi:hypothetical protein
LSSPGCRPNRIRPEEALQWLEGLQGRVTLVDVLAPLGPESADEAWSGDADHL